MLCNTVKPSAVECSNLYVNRVPVAMILVVVWKEIVMMKVKVMVCTGA